jgi:hypothetical protein
MVMAIVDEIERQLRQERCSSRALAYLFCQNTDDKLNNTVSVLRCLVFMLVEQRKELLCHVREEFGAETADCLKGLIAFTLYERCYAPASAMRVGKTYF